MDVRHLLLAAIAPALLVLSLSAGAQTSPQTPRVAFLGLDSRALAPHNAAFVERLRELGYEDGRNVTIDYRWAEGRFDRLPALAAELVGLKPSVIVAIAPPAARAVQKTTTTVPTVILVRDAVAMGFAASLARPGGNMTGVSFQDPEISVKRLDIFREVVPGLSKVAVIWNNQGAGAEAVRALEVATRPMGLELLTLEIKDVADIASIVASAKSANAQGVVQLPSPLVFLNRATLLEALARERLPAMCEETGYAVDGCLMAYSPNEMQMVRQLTEYVVRILRGAKPADLPFQQADRFDFVINLRTARALGLTIPESLLYRATDVIR